MLDMKSYENINAEFWEDFYSADKAPHAPSAFLVWLLAYLPKDKFNVIELGCGNGRDSFGFYKAGHDIYAVDGSQIAIMQCNRIAENLRHSQSGILPGNIKFAVLNLNNIDELKDLALINEENDVLLYSRFLLHAVPKETEQKIMDFCGKTLRMGAIVAHEFRTEKDPLINQGSAVSANERITDHYRRFISANDIATGLKSNGFEIMHYEESNGLAVHKQEDPVVARIIARKIK